MPNVLILLSLSIISITYINISKVNGITLDLKSISNSYSPKDIHGLIQDLGPAVAGKMMLEQKIVTEDCGKPELGELGNDASFSPYGLIADAHNTSGRYKIVNYKVVCLNQGVRSNGHTSTSVIVAYETKDSANTLTKQFHFVCVNGKWTAKLHPNPIDVVNSVSPLVGNFETPTRYDCQMCADPTLFTTATEAEHCVECPPNCESRRCHIDATCASASPCPTGQKYVDGVCMDMPSPCPTGQKYVDGVCMDMPSSCNCLNGGTCDEGGAWCHCIPGYDGAHCEICVIDGCLKCQYTKHDKRAVCIKEMPRECMIRFITEPPTFEELHCNPFEGSGFTLQCEIEVPADLMHVVEVQWKFLTETGDSFDLDAPFLEDFIKVQTTTLSQGNKIRISSTAAAKLEDDSSILGLDVSKLVFKYLKGGAAYCEAKLKGHEDGLYYSQFLIMPTTKPNHLDPCSEQTIYSVSTDKCVRTRPSTDPHATMRRTNFQRKDHQILETDYKDYDPDSDNEGDYSDYDDEDYEDSDYDDYYDYQFDSAEQNFPKEEAGVVFGGGPRGHVPPKNEAPQNVDFQPWIFALSTIGAAVVSVSLTVSVLIIGMYIKKKYMKHKPVFPVVSDSVKSSSTGSQSYTQSNTEGTLDTDSMISRVRREK